MCPNFWLVVYEWLDSFPHLYDYLPLEECIVVLNESGVVMRKRKAEEKKKNSKITWISLSSKKSGWWFWTLDWITLKDRYLRQLLRKSLLRPSSLIFKCSLYWINCLKYKEDFLMNVWSNRNVTAKNFIRKSNFLSFHFILKQRGVMRQSGILPLFTSIKS